MASRCSENHWGLFGATFPPYWAIPSFPSLQLYRSETASTCTKPKALESHLCYEQLPGPMAGHI